MHISSSAQLRSLLRSDPTLKLEFLASLSRLFREHGLEVDPALLAHLTLTSNGVQNAVGPDDDDDKRPPPGPPPAPPPGPPPAPPPGPSPE